MKSLFLAVALAVPAVASAQATPAREEPGYHAQLYQRYCDKLRQSPEAYVQFVNRMKPIYAYTVWDFAPEYDGAAVKAHCKVAPARVAALRQMLAQSTR